MSMQQGLQSNASTIQRPAMAADPKGRPAKSLSRNSRSLDFSIIICRCHTLLSIHYIHTYLHLVRPLPLPPTSADHRFCLLFCITTLLALYCLLPFQLCPYDIMTSTIAAPNNTIYIKNIDWKVKKPLLRRALYSLFTRVGKVRFRSAVEALLPFSALCSRLVLLIGLGSDCLETRWIEGTSLGDF